MADSGSVIALLLAAGIAGGGSGWVVENGGAPSLRIGSTAATASAVATDRWRDEEGVQAPLPAEGPAVGGASEIPGGLAAAVASHRRDGNVWLAWEVAAAPSARSTCCFDRQFHRTTCLLERRNQSWGSSDHGPRPSGSLLVLARLEDGEVGRVVAVDSSCPVDSEGVPLQRVGRASVTESVALLEALVRRQSGEEEDDSALPALSYHAGPPADAALQRLAATGEPSKLREQALFWIGQSRGDAGARYLAGVARGDRSAEIRKKAIFSLSQSDGAGAVDAIVEVAHRDDDPEVRGEALFWLAQTGAEQAPAELLAALDRDPSDEVREKAVFALGQLPKDAGVPLLIQVARERRDPDVRRQAIFWLGQSDDPRAMDFLESVLAER